MRVAITTTSAAKFAKIMDDAASWCGPGCELREMPAEYFVGASERQSVGALKYRSVEASECQGLGAQPTTYAPRSQRSLPSSRVGRSSRSKRS